MQEIWSLENGKVWIRADSGWRVATPEECRLYWAAQLGDAPAPAELDDVAVLRNAANIMVREGYTADGVIVQALHVVSDRLDAARRVLTPLEALEQIAAMSGLAGEGLRAVELARRAIAAEKGEG